MPDVRVIIASGYADEDPELTAHLPETTRMLQKPYNMVDLVSLVQELLS